MGRRGGWRTLQDSLAKSYMCRTYPSPAAATIPGSFTAIQVSIRARMRVSSSLNRGTYIQERNKRPEAPRPPARVGVETGSSQESSPSPCTVTDFTVSQLT